MVNGGGADRRGAMSQESRANPPAAAGAALPPPPPAAPRPLTPAASRRAWHEPRVHFWWIVALVLVAIAAYLAVQQVLAWSNDAKLLRNGKRVVAVVWSSGARIKGRPIAEDERVSVVFRWDGREVAVHSRRLIGWSGDMQTGEPIPIFVDPRDPTNYTARMNPPPLLKQLVGPLLLSSIAAVLAVLSLLKRRGVLATWRHGEARPAAVVETRQTARAPRSRLVRCALTGGADRRLIDVYVPHRAAALQPGDPIWLIMPSGKPDKSIVALLYGPQVHGGEDSPRRAGSNE